MKLMVYGTLQQGYWNNRLLAGARFIGQAVTNKEYVLFDCGFPMAVTAPTKYKPLPIIGEVYEVTQEQLERCDRLEGHPNWYKRELISARLGDRDEEVFIYEMPEKPSSVSLCNIVDNRYYRWVG